MFLLFLDSQKNIFTREELRSSHIGAYSLLFRAFEMPQSGIMNVSTKNKFFTRKKFEPAAQSLQVVKKGQGYFL
ncbi:MAG TPA: hypothetical protein DEP17_01835 [Lachnospiraceae bacterium]|jgi:hypothetical protein|nr:hypothetical protein [Lachnospiraceae bacterium]HCR41401.1 hypothetical protein [Lachnospiraceae bacterium]